MASIAIMLNLQKQFINLIFISFPITNKREEGLQVRSYSCRCCERIQGCRNSHREGSSKIWKAFDTIYE